MPVDVRTVTALAATNGTSVAAAAPAGAWQAGEFGVIFALSVGSDATITCNSTGWTGLTQQNNTTRCRTRIFYKRIEAGDANTSILSTVSQLVTCVVGAFSGVNTATPWDVAEAANTSANSTTMWAPNITTVTKGAMVLRAFMSMDNNQHGTQSEGTLLFGGTSYHTTTGSDGALSCSMLKWKDPAGDTSSASMVQGAGGPDAYVGYTLALRPQPLVFDKPSSEQLFVHTPVQTYEVERNKPRATLFLGETQQKDRWLGSLFNVLFGDIAATEITEGEAGPEERTGTDGFYFYDYRNADRLSMQYDKLFAHTLTTRTTDKLTPVDGVLLSDRKLSEIHKHLADWILLKTVIATEATGVKEVTVVDKLFLLALRQSAREANVLDGLYAFDPATVQEHGFFSLYGALLGDSAQTEVTVPGAGEEERSAVDQILLGDVRQSVLEQLIRLGLMLGDIGVAESGLARVILDGMFVSDAQAMAQEHRAPTDNILLDSIRALIRERLTHDGVLLLDRRLVVMEWVLRDFPFLSDTAVPESTAARLVQATDALFLSSIENRDLAKLVMEWMYVRSATVANRESSLEGARDDLLVATIRLAARELGIADQTLLAWTQAGIRELIHRDYPLFGDSAAAETVGRTIALIDKLMLGETRVTVLEKMVRDAFLAHSLQARERVLYSMSGLWVIDTVLAEYTGTGPAERTHTDKVFLYDGTFHRGTEMSETDTMLVASTMAFAKEILRREGVAIADTTAVFTGAIIREITDRLLMNDYVVRDALKVVRDAVYLAHPTAYREAALVAIAKILMYDSGVTVTGGQPQVNFRSFLEEVLLKDSVVAEVGGIRVVAFIEQFLLSDKRFSELSIPRLDKVFTADPLLMRETEQTVAEAFLLADLVSKGDSFVRLSDYVLLPDKTVKEINRHALERLFVLDTIDRVVELGWFSVDATDTLLLNENRFSELLRNMADAAGVTDLRFSELMRHFVDRPLVGDADFQERLRGDLLRYTADTLLLGDERFSELMRSTVDSLLINALSSLAREVLRADGVEVSDSAVIDKGALREALDMLFLYDSFEVLAGGRLFAVDDLDGVLLLDSSLLLKNRDSIITATDSIVFGEELLQILERMVREGVTLDEAVSASRHLTRAQTDYLMFLSQIAGTNYDLNLIDETEFSETMGRMREIVIESGLYTSEVITAGWFPYIIEYLIWAKVQVIRLLGVQTRSMDHLGRKIKSVDYLGRSVGYNYVPSLTVH